MERIFGTIFLIITSIHPNSNQDSKTLFIRNNNFNRNKFSINNHILNHDQILKTQILNRLIHPILKFLGNLGMCGSQIQTKIIYPNHNLWVV